MILSCFLISLVVRAMASGSESSVATEDIHLCQGLTDLPEPLSQYYEGFSFLHETYPRLALQGLSWRIS